MTDDQTGRNPAGRNPVDLNHEHARPGETRDPFDALAAEIVTLIADRYEIGQHTETKPEIPVIAIRD